MIVKNEQTPIKREVNLTCTQDKGVRLSSDVEHHAITYALVINKYIFLASYGHCVKYLGWTQHRCGMTLTWAASC